MKFDKTAILISFFTTVWFSIALAGQGAKYGHLPYKVVNQADLVKVGSYPDGRPKKLTKEARDAYKKMVKAAEENSVRLTLISAFRSRGHQRYLFNRAVRRHGSKVKAAKWVAPPGYSEHHTGRAVDIGDADLPGSHLKPSFAKTDAFKWLMESAEGFGFYLSFPEGNPQGIGCEPWHWCYRGGQGAVQKTKD